ncbi:MAG: TetR/AcrR family transcriptional regulator [Eubacteriales bacterium]
MPQIFHKIGRNKIQENLFDAGFKLIKKYGLKKTSIADISCNAGIATGTFYNFFPSKEEFIYQLIIYKRNIAKMDFETLVANGKIDKETFRKYLRKVYLSDDNVFDYLDDKDIAMLNTRWSEENWKSERNDEKTTKWLLSHLIDVNPNCEWKVFANLSKSISLIRYGKVRLYEAEYEKMLDIYLDAIIRYIFYK